MGDYHNKYQVGWVYQGSVGRIAPAVLDRYLSKDGLPDLSNPIVAHPIEIKSVNDLTAENVTLNGQPAELLRRTGSDVTAVFFFPPLKTPIETVKVSITPPASGEYPAQFFTADEGACSQDITVNSGDFWSGIAWYDTTGGSAVPQ